MGIQRWTPGIARESLSCEASASMEPDDDGEYVLFPAVASVLESREARYSAKEVEKALRKHLGADVNTPQIDAIFNSLSAPKPPAERVTVERKDPYAPPCSMCGRSDGWHTALGHPPAPVGDCRKIVWLRDKDGMEWWGVRAYNHSEGCWQANGTVESSSVMFWMETPHSPHYPPAGLRAEIAGKGGAA